MKPSAEDGPRGSRVLPKKEILRGRKNFKDLFRSGREIRTRHLKFLVLENGKTSNRAAFVVGKKSGNSCFRNYSRRIFREIFRKLKGGLPTGYDIAVILRNSRFHSLDFPEKEREISSGLDRIADTKR